MNPNITGAGNRATQRRLKTPVVRSHIAEMRRSIAAARDRKAPAAKTRLGAPRPLR